MSEAGSVFRARSFAFLGVGRTGHGVALLQAVLARGLRPRLGLIAAETREQLEASTPFFETPGWWRWPHRRRVLRALAGVLGPEDETAIAHVYRRAGVPFLFTPALDSDVAVDMLRRSGVQAGVLAEAPILRGAVLTATPAGLLNVHAAPLPAYRGNWATCWALWHDEPLAVSAHLVEERADRGPILAVRPLPVRRGDTLEDIDRRGFRVCGELAAEVLARARTRPGVPLRVQRDWEGRTFRGPMPEEIRAELARRLAAGDYSFFTPEPAGEDAA